MSQRTHKIITSSSFKMKYHNCKLATGSDGIHTSTEVSVTHRLQIKQTLTTTRLRSKHLSITPHSQSHPCHSLACFLTLREEIPRPTKGVASNKQSKNTPSPSLTHSRFSSLRHHHHQHLNNCSAACLQTEKKGNWVECRRTCNST